MFAESIQTAWSRTRSFEEAIVVSVRLHGPHFMLWWYDFVPPMLVLSRFQAASLTCAAKACVGLFCYDPFSGAGGSFSHSEISSFGTFVSKRPRLPKSRNAEGHMPIVKRPVRPVQVNVAPKANTPQEDCSTNASETTPPKRADAANE
jgi:hypothetical protein